MKTLPFALAVSASALVISLGWFGWLSTHSTPRSSGTAHGSSALPQTSIALPDARPVISDAVYAREDHGMTPQAGSVRNGRTPSVRPLGSSMPVLRSEQSASLQADPTGNMPASAPQYFAERRSSYPQASPSEISDHLPASPAVTFRGSSLIGYVDVELGPGARVPVALSGKGEASSPEVVQAKEQIAREFENEILQIAERGSGKPEELDKAWTEAQKRADNRLRLFYGKDVFNRESLRSGQKESSADRLPE